MGEKYTYQLPLLLNKNNMFRSNTRTTKPKQNCILTFYQNLLSEHFQPALFSPMLLSRMSTNTSWIESQSKAAVKDANIDIGIDLNVLDLLCPKKCRIVYQERL